MLNSRAGWGPRTFFSTNNNQLPSLSGVHSLSDFLCSDHLVESFYGRSYTYGSVLKSNFYNKTTQQDGHYRAISSNTMNSWQWGELIAVCRKKCSGASSRPSDTIMHLFIYKPYNNILIVTTDCNDRLSSELPQLRGVIRAPRHAATHRGNRPTELGWKRRKGWYQYIILQL